MNISEGITPGADISALVAGNISFSEEVPVPRFHLTFDCFGPDEADRAEYLHRLSLAEQAMDAGNLSLSERLMKAADELVKHQWQEVRKNLVTNTGRNDLIDKYFKGSSYTAAWYLGLKNTGTVAAADTSASHAGWTEEAGYSAATRPAITFGTTASQSNAASAVAFSMNATYSAYGAFIIANNTKSGTTGILYSAVDFSVARTGGSGDTLNVTPTVTT